VYQRVAGLVVLFAASACDLVFGLEGLVDAPKICGPECLDVLASAEGGAAELVVDGGELYWTINRQGGAIRGCTIEGCQPRTLAVAEDQPHSLFAFRDRLIWASGTELRQVPTPSVEASATVIHTQPSVILSVIHLGTYLYWTGNGLLRCDYQPVSGACTLTTTINNGSDPIFQLERALEVDTSGVLWGSSPGAVFETRFSPIGVARQFPTGARTDVVKTASTAIFALRRGDTKILTWPLSAPDGAAASPIELGGSPWALALSDGTLYVADQTGRVLAVPLIPAPGAPVVIAENLESVSAIAIDATRIYLAAGDVIATLPRR
jgi:hypothetical protein